MNSCLCFWVYLIMTTTELKQALRAHSLYPKLNHPEALRHFMEHHVYAVWDFMSLVKKLQIELTCVQVPWVPVGQAEARHLINEIVAGEEADVLPDGRYLSHFEMYVEAMKQCGAEVSSVLALVSAAQAKGSLPGDIKVPQAAKEFMEHSFALIEHGGLHEVAAAFTLGREDLIPDMFQGMVETMNEAEKGKWSLYLYYLERHIEVDGGQHADMAKRLVTALCGGDKVKEMQAEEAGRAALVARLKFWDAIEQGLPAVEAN